MAADAKKPSALQTGCGCLVLLVIVGAVIGLLTRTPGSHNSPATSTETQTTATAVAASPSTPVATTGPGLGLSRQAFVSALAPLGYTFIAGTPNKTLGPNWDAHADTAGVQLLGPASDLREAAFSMIASKDTGQNQTAVAGLAAFLRVAFGRDDSQQINWVTQEVAAKADSAKRTFGAFQVEVTTVPSMGLIVVTLDPGA